MLGSPRGGVMMVAIIKAGSIGSESCVSPGSVHMSVVVVHCKSGPFADTVRGGQRRPRRRGSAFLQSDHPITAFVPR